MKVAICISGQLRSWEDCYETWIKLVNNIKTHPNFIDKDIEFDYFFHIWDFNTIPEFEWREKYKKLGYVKKMTQCQKMKFKKL